MTEDGGGRETSRGSREAREADSGARGIVGEDEADERGEDDEERDHGKGVALGKHAGKG